MKPQFIDTHALIAVLDPRDIHHYLAVSELEQPGKRFVTSEWILTELADAFCKPSVRALALKQIASIRANTLHTIIGYERDVLNAAYNLYTSRPDKAWSLTDCTSFGPVLKSVSAAGGRPTLTLHGG
jgi:predicted nucleic acid-binding protein